MLYHGSKPEREILRKDIYKSTEVDGTWWSQPVVCTSYEVAMMDRQYLMSMQWKYLIVDEGHRIKNSQCRLIKYVFILYLFYIYSILILHLFYIFRNLNINVASAIHCLINTCTYIQYTYILYNTKLHNKSFILYLLTVLCKPSSFPV